MEFAFLVGLLRKATKENIQPVRATAKPEMRNHAYANFIGVGITLAEKNQLVFSKTDLLLPFISSNESMWEFFEPELNKRLSMMETDDSYAARVRSALMELLPSGECSIEDVSSFMRAFSVWTGNTVNGYRQLSCSRAGRRGA